MPSVISEQVFFIEKTPTEAGKSLDFSSDLHVQYYVHWRLFTCLNHLLQSYPIELNSERHFILIFVFVFFDQQVFFYYLQTEYIVAEQDILRIYSYTSIHYIENFL